MLAIPHHFGQSLRGQYRHVLVAVLALALVVSLGAIAEACPTCGSGMAEGGEAGQKMLSGWFWSIVFMMSMPFAIVTSLGGYMYWIVRKAQRTQATTSQETAAPVDNRLQALPPSASPSAM